MSDEITDYLATHPYRAEWYGRNGAVRQAWFGTLAEAEAEAAKHRDSCLYIQQDDHEVGIVVYGSTNEQTRRRK